MKLHINLKQLTVFAVAFSATALLLGSAQSFAATKTWTGAGGDNKWSTAANWNPSGAPTNGDSVVLSAIDDVHNDVTRDLNNDIDVALSGIEYTPRSSDGTKETLYSVSSLHLADNAVITQVQVLRILNVKGPVVADGSIIAHGYAGFSVPISQPDVSIPNLSIDSAIPWCAGGDDGRTRLMSFRPTNLTIGDNTIWDARGSEHNIVVGVGSGLSLPYSPNSNVSFGANITFNGGGSQQGPSCIGNNTHSLSGYGDKTITLTGTITMNGGDIVYILGGTTKLKITGTIKGTGSKLKPHPQSTGTFINQAASDNSSTPKGKTTPKVTTLPPITDSSPDTSLSLINTTQALDGVRGYVYVDANGTLKGNGTMSRLYVYPGGIVAPGHSPGKLTVKESLSFNGGTYEVEVAGAQPNQYDRIVVNGNNSPIDVITLGGTDANRPTLSIKLLKGFHLKAGDKLKIIDNKSNKPVTGYFKNLKEGSTIKLDSTIFKITYKGGDGNDVVLTVVNTPVNPDTGLAISTLNPITLTAITIAGSLGIALLARYRKLSSVR